MIPPGLRQVVEACLRKNPADRPEPSRLIAMINELGPATPVTLGSFWPEAVARVIAADQASQTPDGLTPPEPFTEATPAAGSGRMSGSTNFTSPAPAERTPTALATPAPEQVASATGHAPMLSDGYYAAAAQGRPALRHARSGPSIPPMPAPPQAYGGQPPYGVQPPAGQAPAASYPDQASYSAQAPSYPGQQPGSGDVLSQYAPARRKPATGEVPRGVHTAVRLMYAGFAATVLNLLLSLSVFGVLVADILGLACWAWLAVATRRGHGWTRIAGTVLLAVYSIAALLVVFDTKNDPGAEFTTLVVWALGVAAVIPLWSQQAREFFYTWRRPD
jgi:hypothetical protein